MQRLKSNVAGKIFAAVGLAGLLALGATTWQPRTGAQERAVQRQRDAQGAFPAAKRHADTLSAAFRAAAEATIPTVVTIETRSKPRSTAGRRGGTPRPNPFEGTPFEDFFDEDDMFGFGEMPHVPRQGVGSGVIVDESGIVLTNNHVVQGADTVTVRLHDGREFTATDIKTDPQTDLAVVHLEGAESLPAAKLGDSSTLEVGDWVLAIGTPFELSSTVSAGIISGKARELTLQRTRYLQTDAAINPGNSGGPLVNLDGEVVGINTAIASNNGSFQGIGFAIPSNLARWVMSQLIETGTVQRGYLGVGIQATSGELAEQLGLDGKRGVLVAEVFPGTPAAEAGFEAGDVIVEYAGKPVNTPRDLQELVERTEAGSKESVVVTRDGKPRELEVTVKPLPEDLAGATGAPATQRSPGVGAGYTSEELGIGVSQLTEASAQQLGFEAYRGVLVTEVDPAGPAAAAGLREGMLIMRVGKRQVESLEEFQDALEKESLEAGVLLLVRTEAGNRFVVIERE